MKIYRRAQLTTILLALNLAWLYCTVPGADDPVRPSEKGSARTLDEIAASLQVIDEAGKTHTISAHDFAGLPHRSVSAKVGESDSTCEGVSLVDLLESMKSRKS